MHAKQIIRSSSMKSLGRVSLAVAIAAMAAACTPTTRYYTMSAVQPDAPLAAASLPAGAVVAVGPVDLPDYVDRPQIVVRTGQHMLEQAAFAQWGGDLNDMVPRLLADDLGQRLPGAHMVDFPAAGDVPWDYRVPVNISRFDVSETGEAVITAHWQVRGKPGSADVVVRESVATAQAKGNSYSDRVDALSRALGVVADDIAKALTTLSREGPKAARKAGR